MKGFLHLFIYFVVCERDVSIFECGGEELVERNGLHILQREQAGLTAWCPWGDGWEGRRLRGKKRGRTGSLLC